MQFFTIFTVLAAAMTAAAAPGGGSPTVTSCTNVQQNTCCTEGLAGVLTCLVSALGGPCSGQAYCCETNNAQVSPN